MAVGVVDREPVSGPNSLIHRESTGKSSESGFPARPASPIRPLPAVLSRVFPGFGTREFSAVEHGFPATGIELRRDGFAFGSGLLVSLMGWLRGDDYREARRQYYTYIEQARAGAD
jgi:hypothetical protein